MSDDTPFQVLSDDQLEAYKNEAKKRWGHTDAYQQSVKRTQNWTRDDIKRVQQEWQQLLSAVAETMDRGVDSVETQKEIEAIYQHLHQFYDPSPELFEGLGTMYVEDSRFHETFEKIKPGLAEYTRDAIKHFVSVRYT